MAYNDFTFDKEKTFYLDNGATDNSREVLKVQVGKIFDNHHTVVRVEAYSLFKGRVFEGEAVIDSFVFNNLLGVLEGEQLTNLFIVNRAIRDALVNAWKLWGCEISLENPEESFYTGYRWMFTLSPADFQDLTRKEWEREQEAKKDLPF